MPFTRNPNWLLFLSSCPWKHLSFVHIRENPAIAEKFHAMVVLDIRNSRMKDFYDVWFMANTWTFDMASLRNAILASFERRGSTIPTGVPFALTDDFLNDPQKKQQWTAFVSRLNPGEQSPIS